MQTATETKHAPTPWHVDDDYGTTVQSDVGRVALMGDGDQAEADATRIVQCVNACEGIADPVGQIKIAREILSDLVNHCQPGASDDAQEPRSTQVQP